MKKKTVTLEVFFDILNVELKIEKRKIDNMFTVHGDYVDLLDGGCLVGEYGIGKTANLAARNYAKILAGKTIIINAGDYTRREIKVPDYLT
jgi:hypothetical protein